MREHLIVSPIRSSEIACAQQSGVRQREDTLQRLDFGNGLVQRASVTISNISTATVKRDGINDLSARAPHTQKSRRSVFGGEELYDANCEAVRVESLKVRKQNDGQVRIDEMGIFDHPGTDVKNHAVTVEYVRIPASCELAFMPIV